MYLKLALRNAKRSASNYLLYMTTMTICTAVMAASNCLAVQGGIEGLETASLPLLAAVVLTVLTGYINRFMFKERAKEFAGYMLLGMEKSHLSWMFLMEFWVVGLACFAVGGLAGPGIAVALLPVQGATRASVLTQSLIQTFCYFCVVEIFSTCGIKRAIDKLEIKGLMMEKRRNQPSGGKRRTRLWGALCGIGLVILTGILWAIAFLPAGRGLMLISIVSLPLLLAVFAFYKWLYQFLAEKRQAGSEPLYRRSRLYTIAHMTSGTTAHAVMSGVFCMSLMISACSFVFGSLLLQPGVAVFDAEGQRWMGFLQIGLCVIFIVVYFSILSLHQIIEFKRDVRNITLLHHLGNDRTQIKALIRKQICIRLSLPAVMCVVPLLIGAPLVNHRLNTLLPAGTRNITIKLTGWFFVCFLVLYLCYFFVTRAMCKENGRPHVKKGVRQR